MMNQPGERVNEEAAAIASPTFSMSLQSRLLLTRKAISFFLLIGIAFSFELWIPERFFPLLPVFDMLAFQSYFLHYLFFCLLLLLLVGNAFIHTRLMNALLVLILSVLLLQDQNRWQPWVYIYLLFLLPFTTTNMKTDQNSSTLSYFQIIIIGIYLWSGIHKLNINFVNDTFHQILTQLFSLSSPGLVEAIKPLGYAIAVIEVGIAVTLFLPRFRNLGVCAAIISHLFILAYLSPLGINSNSVVYPWNVAMMLLVFTLFYNSKGNVLVRDRHNRLPYNAAGILLVWIMPFFNFFGLWDNYLSFNLYSGKIDVFYIAIGDQELGKIDVRLHKYFLEVEGLQGGEIIDINKWAMDALNVPFYPETRNLKKIGKRFCKLEIREDQLYFLQFELPMEKVKFKRFTCAEVHH